MKEFFQSRMTERIDRQAQLLEKIARECWDERKAADIRTFSRACLENEPIESIQRCSRELGVPIKDGKSNSDSGSSGRQ